MGTSKFEVSHTWLEFETDKKNWTTEELLAMYEPPKDSDDLEIIDSYDNFEDAKKAFEWYKTRLRTFIEDEVIHAEVIHLLENLYGENGIFFTDEIDGYAKPI